MEMRLFDVFHGDEVVSLQNLAERTHVDPNLIGKALITYLDI